MKRKEKVTKGKIGGNKPSGVGGLGVPKPAMGPRVGIKPGDDAQQSIQQSMR